MINLFPIAIESLHIIVSSLKVGGRMIRSIFDIARVTMNKLKNEDNSEMLTCKQLIRKAIFGWVFLCNSYNLTTTQLIACTFDVSCYAFNLSAKCYQNF